MFVTTTVLPNKRNHSIYNFIYELYIVFNILAEIHKNNEFLYYMFMLKVILALIITSTGFYICRWRILGVIDTR